MNRGLFRAQSNIYNGAFCEDNFRLKAVNYFRKKAPSMFDWVLNTPQMPFEEFLVG